MIARLGLFLNKSEEPLVALGRVGIGSAVVRGGEEPGAIIAGLFFVTVTNVGLGYREKESAPTGALVRPVGWCYDPHSC